MDGVCPAKRILICQPAHEGEKRVEERHLAIHAIELSKNRNVEFIDAYLALKALQADQEVCTFDETDFKKLPAKWTLLPG